MFKAKFNHPDNRTFEKPEGTSFPKEQVTVRVADVFIKRQPDGNPQGLAKIFVYLSGVCILDMPFHKNDFDYEKPAVEQMYNHAKELKMVFRSPDSEETKEVPYFEDIENC